MPLRVLSCSPNLDLAMLRGAVLRTAECDVVCPVSQTDAINIMQEEKFDVLLICYDYSEEAGEEICDAFKKSNPDGRIIALRKSHRDAACAAEVGLRQLRPAGPTLEESLIGAIG